MALVETKMMTFRDIFAETIDTYREYVKINEEMKSLILARKPYSTEKYTELVSMVENLFSNYELGKYLDLIIEFLGTLKMDNYSYRDFDLKIERAIREFKDARDIYMFISNKIRNERGLFKFDKSVSNIIDGVFTLDNTLKDVPFDVREKIREEIVRNMIRLRVDIFSEMDIRQAIDFIDFTENFYIGPLEVLRQICRGQRSDFQMPLQVCSAFDNIVTNRLYPEYLTRIADMIVPYGVNRQEVYDKLRPIVLGENSIFYRLDANTSKGAISLVVLDKFKLGMFDLSAKKPELLFIARLLVDLEKVRKRICLAKSDKANEVV